MTGVVIDQKHHNEGGLLPGSLGATGIEEGLSRLHPSANKGSRQRFRQVVAALASEARSL